MKCMERNKRTIYYALYENEQPLYDEDGYETGEYTSGYSNPVELKINVSPASGENATRLFGDVLDYDRTLVTSDMDLPITETSVLWIDETDTTKPHDYIVKRVAKGLDSILIAVKKVEVSHGA